MRKQFQYMYVSMRSWTCSHIQSQKQNEHVWIWHKIQKSDCRTMHWSSGTWATCLKPSLLPMRWKHAAWLAKSAVVGLKCRPLEIGVKSCESLWIDRKLGEPMLTTRLIFCPRGLIACSPAYLWRLHQQQWNSTSESRHQICFICQQSPAIHQPNQGKLRHILTKSNMDEASPVVCFVRSTLWWLRGHEDLRTFSVKKNVVTISKLQGRLKQIQHPKQHCAIGKKT